ncbi:CGNR zinc finger domain-containing protein [Kibdelosporangium philippinense]|uniref:CGNR zinc finger domain-containing protein n=1 Tax=Kibdelosporangium philippinense TaxID=211113 RepID=A0ABS8Z7E7_9PSEU|nr:CGNR zinc finger domain-containing protein [Kibdelosporangium philippinense]MCE7003811.1 CGNR zinc finger domain-containing protein [Kibdelosporangium philippinense]
MNFDSHASDVVAAAVQAVNVLTPGEALGRAYAADEPDVSGLAGGAEAAGKDVDELRGYASRLRAIFEAVDTGHIDQACVVTNALLADTQAVPRLIKHDNEPWHIHFHAGSASWARGWAASMATALAIVLGNPMSDRLGVCTATACDRVFVDVSRNGTKRFCSTACQNRIKAAAFRARKQV